MYRQPVGKLLLALVEASPTQHREISRTQVFRGKTWTPPTLANGILYLRDEHELVALDINAPAPASPVGR